MTETKKLLKPFVIVFAVAFFAINWENVSWVFNYRAVLGYFSSIAQKNEIVLPSVAANYSEKENSIEIPKIELAAPFIISETLAPDSLSADFKKELDKGVILFPETSLPGQAGQSVVLGHSAPPNWPKIKHDWVFSRLNDLAEGDEVVLYFNHKKFSYTVRDKIFLDKGEEIPKSEISKSKNTIVMVSCWPPGKNFKRIAVEAVLDEEL